MLFPLVLFRNLRSNRSALAGFTSFKSPGSVRVCVWFLSLATSCAFAYRTLVLYKTSLIQEGPPFQLANRRHLDCSDNTAPCVWNSGVMAHLHRNTTMLILRILRFTMACSRLKATSWREQHAVGLWYTVCRFGGCFCVRAGCAGRGCCGCGKS